MNRGIIEEYEINRPSSFRQINEEITCFEDKDPSIGKSKRDEFKEETNL